MAEENKGSSMELHAHGDGSYHTISKGGGGYYPYSEKGGEPGRKEHASFGAAVMHMAKHHATGDHFHAQGHDEGFTAHSLKEGGSVKGPTEHETMGSLKKNMASALNDEGDEG
jgi:hypothetical protein